jgi:pimeloyl-ACP methyl ester carboxylesterase
MRTVDINIDGLPGGNHVAASVFLPEHLPDDPIVIFASPGGGYARGYFDLRLPGRSGYSQAEHHAARGIILVAYDHPGVGASGLDGLDTMTIETIAAANDDAVRKIARKLETGALADGLRPLTPKARIGIGQSMGGGVTIIMQGRHRTFGAIAALGYSAIHTVLPQRSERDVERGKAIFHFSRETDVHALSVAQTSAQVPDFIYPFHWEDVPAEIVQADLGRGFPVRDPMPPWASATIPNCVVAMMAPDFVRQEAAMIDVPVLMAFGERDVSPNPHMESSAFPLSRHVSLYVAPRMAHMHNFASTRHLLWEHVADWAETIARDGRR